MEVVAFKDGTFGVREKFLWQYSYNRQDHAGFWYSSMPDVVMFCRFTEQEARDRLSRLVDKGTPVK